MEYFMQEAYCLTFCSKLVAVSKKHLLMFMELTCESKQPCAGSGQGDSTTIIHFGLNILGLP